MNPTPEGANMLEFPGSWGKVLSFYGLTEGPFTDGFLRVRSAMRKNNAILTVPITGRLAGLHPSFIRKYRKGIEYALLGYSYQDYSRIPFEMVRKHIDTSIGLFSRFNLKPRGFRCPHLLWSDKILEALQSYDFLYESNGAILWDNVINVNRKMRNEINKYYEFRGTRKVPSIPTIEKGIVRMPMTLPNDQLLYHIWSIRDPELYERVLLSLLAASYERGDFLSLDFHTEYYKEFMPGLKKLLATAAHKQPPVWFASLEETARWWLERNKFIFDMKERKDGYEITGDVPNTATILVRGAGTDTKCDPWLGRWKSSRKGRFTIKSNRIPGIGVAPGTPKRLIEFLKAEGFIVDESTGRDRFAIYIDDFYRFDYENGDALRLLKRIETVYAPLARLWRWPHRARCAIAVTLDIEAITLLDFLRRKKG